MERVRVYQFDRCTELMLNGTLTFRSLLRRRCTLEIVARRRWFRPWTYRGVDDGAVMLGLGWQSWTWALCDSAQSVHWGWRPRDCFPDL